MRKILLLCLALSLAPLIGCSGGKTSQGPTPPTWYKDADADGYSDGTTKTATNQPAGYKLAADLIATSGDCNDANPFINPDAIELFDSIDNNCDGYTDEGWVPWYRDVDGDGYANGETEVNRERPNGFRLPAELIALSGDCDDTEGTVHPNASEIFDHKDNDCNGSTDEGWSTWYRDADDDGYSDGSTLIAKDRPSGYRLQADLTGAWGDCNDDDAAIHPGTGAACDVASLDADTSANHYPLSSQSIASNQAGDQMAVWLADTGSGYKILAAFKPAASADWEPETVLGSGYYNSWDVSITSIKVISNGTDFMVAWAGNNVVIHATRYQKTGPTQWNWEPTVIAAGHRDFGIATNGTGYAISYLLNHTVEVMFHDGTSWGNPVELGYSTSESPTLCSNGAGYLVAVCSATSSYVCIWNGTSWSFADLPNGDINARFDVASNGSGYGIVWYSDFAYAYAALLTEAIPGTWEVRDLFEIGTSDFRGSVHVSSNGEGYLAVWSNTDIEGQTICRETRHDGTAWSTSEPIAAFPEAPNELLELASDGEGYALLYCGYSDGSLSYIGAISMTEAAWSAAAPLPVLPDFNPSSFLSASAPNRYLFLFPKEGRVYPALLDNGEWSVGKDLIKGFHRGGSTSPRITRADDGTVLATWVQKHGWGSGLFARLRIGGVWGDPTMLSTFVDEGYDVATNGVDFMVTDFSTLYPTILKCSPTTEGGWQWAPTSNSPDRIAEGGMKLVSNGSGYLLLWGKQPLWGSQYDGDNWSPSVQISPVNAGWVEAIDAASNGTGYTTIFQTSSGQNGHVYARSWDGAQWGTVENLDNTNYPFKDAQVASDGIAYTALWSGPPLKSGLLSGGLWSSSATAVYSLAADLLATSPGVYQAALTNFWTYGDVADIYATTITEGVWGTPSLLGSQAGTRHNPAPVLAQCGGDPVMAWSLGGASGDVFRTSRLDNGDWGSTTDWSHPGRDSWSHDIAGGPVGCDLVWTEEDPADPSVYRLRLPQ